MKQNLLSLTEAVGEERRDMACEEGEKPTTPAFTINSIILDQSKATMNCLFPVTPPDIYSDLPPETSKTIL